MVDSIRPIYRSLPVKNTTGRVQEAPEVQTHSEDAASEEFVYSRERRQRKDRRDKGGNPRSVYDLRSGRGRRKEDGGQPHIEIKV